MDNPILLDLVSLILFILLLNCLNLDFSFIKIHLVIKIDLVIRINFNLVIKIDLVIRINFNWVIKID